MIYNKRERGRVGEKKGEGRGRTADVSIGFKSVKASLISGRDAIS